MSRSRKKVPIVKDRYSGKWSKRQANKKVRKEQEISIRGKDYKKIYESWNIHDYINYYSKEDAIKDWYEEESLPTSCRWRHKRYETLEKWLFAWEKMMLNK